MNLRQQSNLLRAFLLLTLLLSALGLYRFARPVYEGGLLGSMKWQIVIGLGCLGILIALVLLILTWTPLWGRVINGLESGLAALSRLKGLNYALFFAFVAAMALLIFGPLGGYLLDFYSRLLLFWLVSVAGAILLKAGGVQRGWAELLAASLLLTGIGYKIGSYLPDVSLYPFTLGWSEASRYYYASLYFSQRLYGTAAPPTVLHPSRYLMQSLPFLIPNSPLWLHRLWQVLLWIGTTGLTSWLLARRLAIPDRLRQWLVVAWASLFLILGPVYYHLQVPVILVLGFFDRRNLWKTLGVVLLASAWAGISRVNWFPVPAMLAAALYFLEQPVVDPRVSEIQRKAEFQRIIAYLVPPLLWGILGTATAFGAQALYALWSKNPAEQFTSSFSSDLLWYRLFPNTTYPLGILFSILLVSLPLAMLIFGRLSGAWRAFHFIRLLGLAALLLLLFAVGVVVSTKIGGGSNLHNLDAYSVLLMVIGSYIYFNRFTPDRPEQMETTRPSWSSRPIFYQAAIALAILVPLYFALDSSAPMFHYNPQQAQETLATIREYAQNVAAQGGEVLFISERQLITFHNIEGVKLAPEYEKVFLQEMAMAGNPDYLNQFHNDLKNHRFGLIVSEPLFTREKGSEQIFGEENDAWVNQVSKPVLCYYRPRKSLLTGVPIQLLVPRNDSADCP